MGAEHAHHAGSRNRPAAGRTQFAACMHGAIRSMIQSKVTGEHVPADELADG